jgi:hypothetical protein
MVKFEKYFREDKKQGFGSAHFHADANPDQAFHFNADTDPDPAFFSMQIRIRTQILLLIKVRPTDLLGPH